MNIIKGGSRLIAVLSWLVAICVWIAWLILYDDGVFIWHGVGLIIGILAGFICNRIGHWVLEGFVIDQENND